MHMPSACWKSIMASAGTTIAIRSCPNTCSQRQPNLSILAPCQPSSALANNQRALEPVVPALDSEHSRMSS